MCPHRLATLTAQGHAVCVLRVTVVLTDRQTQNTGGEHGFSKAEKKKTCFFSSSLGSTLLSAVADGSSLLCLAKAAVKHTHGAQAYGCWALGRRRGTGAKQPGCSHRSRIGSVCVPVHVHVYMCSLGRLPGGGRGGAGTPPTSLPSLTGHQSDLTCPSVPATLTCAGGSLGITPSRCT